METMERKPVVQGMNNTSLYQLPFRNDKMVSLSMVTHGFVSGWTSPTVGQFQSADSPVPMTGAQLSWVLGAANLGAVFGPLPSALLMTRLGCRGTLLLLNLLPVLAWLLTYYATSFPLLLAARVLAGSWIGVTFTIVPNYISEIVDPNLRSSLITLPSFMQRSGTLAVFFIGNLVSYWNLSVIGFIIGSTYWLVLIFVPESPYFYIENNQEENAIKSLTWLYGEERARNEFNVLRTFIESNETTKPNGCLDLFDNPKQVKNTMKVSVASLLMVVSGGMLIVILPLLIPTKAFMNWNNQECAVIVAVVNLIFSYRPNCLSPFGNKFAIIMSATVCGTCMAIMALWHYFEDRNDFVKYDLYWVPFITYVVNLMFFSMYMQPIVIALRGEMFPTKYKASLAAIVTVLTSIAVTVILKSFIPIKELFGTSVNFLFASGSSFCLALFTYFFLIETKGKSLQEIQKELNVTGIK